MLRIGETQFVSYLAEGLAGVEDAGFGDLERSELDVLQGRCAGFFLQEVAQVVGRETEAVGTILDGGQTIGGRLARQEIVVQEGFEAGEDVAV